MIVTVLMVIIVILLMLKLTLAVEAKLFGTKIVSERIDSIAVPIPHKKQSPYEDDDFHEVEGVIEPKHSTISMLLGHIEFEIASSPSLDKRLMYYTIEVRWMSNIEDYYDIRWVEGSLKMSLIIKFPVDEFGNHNPSSDQFRHRLEAEARRQMWNYYYSRYPHIFQHPIITKL